MVNRYSRFQKKKVAIEELDVFHCSITDLAKKMQSFIEVIIANELRDLSLPVFFESA